MATPRKHIEPTADLIRRYLAGELDDQTMHALDRQALEDPFLAEALEGYGKSPRSRDPELADLRARLQQRAAQPPAPTGMVRRLARRWLAAAGVLLLISISALFLFRRPADKEVAQELPAAKKQEDTAFLQPAPAAAPQAPESTQTLMDAGATVQPQPPAPKPRESKPVPGNANTARAEEARRREATPVAEADAPAAVAAAPAAAPPPPPAKRIMIRGTGNASTDERTSGGTEGIAKNNSNPFNADTVYIGRKPSPLAKKSEEPAAMTQGKVAGVESKYPSHHESHDIRLISGKVLDATTGEIMGGAIVHERSTNKRVVTDSSGQFAITVNAGARTSIDVSMIGYQHMVVPVPTDKSNFNIYLPASDNALSETVIVTGGKGRAVPQPALGQAAYRHYLEALPPVPVPGLAGDLAGEVRVTFTVHSDSTLHQIKAVKPFHPAAGEAAVKRLEQGPKWSPVKGRKGKAEIMVPVKLIPGQ
ncbi:carboxypeptidase-like regulatory domain-containing protein [Chitinophaga sp.]|uniref:carboxypeptidase-like regulatory domain-containing protein n=1 Tax=Chitinophaga sp. TaxID=1869181 RepID=UPI002626EEDE|nr:carboxypeptidase-like regulatory domain-containing protein [uncultured Chitinophaga sp.]